MELPEWFSRLDLDAIEDARNKIDECEYFLALASRESDRTRFRWLVSAFFSSAYSFFEMSALRAYLSFTASDTGQMLEDPKALGVLRGYVAVLQDKKNPSYVKTSGQHPITKQLYELRRLNTHHFPLAIMAAGPDLPEDFEFGNMRGEGTPALAFCREVMALVLQVRRELDT